MAFDGLLTEIQANLGDVVEAFGNLDGQTASAKLREAANRTREAAELLREPVPDAAELFQEAADAIDRSAESAEQDDFMASGNSAETGTTLVNDAREAIDASGVQDC